MAPEVYRGEAYGPSVDMYSLGTVLYRLLNDNRAPFLPDYPIQITHNSREAALAKRISGAKLPTPKNADGRLAEIILKACAYDPKDRYSSPMIMRQDLEEIFYSRNDSPMIYTKGDATPVEPVQFVGEDIPYARSRLQEGTEKLFGKTEIITEKPEDLFSNAFTASEKTESLFRKTEEKTEKASGATVKVKVKGKAKNAFDTNTPGDSITKSTSDRKRKTRVVVVSRLILLILSILLFSFGVVYLISSNAKHNEDLAALQTNNGEATTSSLSNQKDSYGMSNLKQSVKIALITMDSKGQNWSELNEGAQKAAAELGVTVDFMAPEFKDEAHQIELVNFAASNGYQAILVAANGLDAISGALKAAIDAGVKIVCVDSPANVIAEATFRTDDYFAGKTAGELMFEAFSEFGVSSGNVGIVAENESSESIVQREAGFREVFDGSGFNVLDTLYSEGSESISQSIAGFYVSIGAAGIFGADEESTFRIGNAIKASGNNAVVGVGVGISDETMNLVNDGWLLCVMAQNWYGMGYEGVKAAVEAIGGKSIGGEVMNVGVTIFDGRSHDPVNDTGIKIALIAMDSFDRHWLTLNDGAQKAAAELGVTVDFMSPDFKEDAKQIEKVNDAVANGYQAIVVAANGPEAISGALEEAIAAGIRIVYVDSPANVPAEATFWTDNYAAGKTAGEQFLEALTAVGLASGKIGVVDVNATIDSVVQRNAGFRDAFAGSGFEILETRFCDGDAGKAQNIAVNYIAQGVVAIFGINEGSTIGIGKAIKFVGNKGIMGAGFDKSDAITNLIDDGWLLFSVEQKPYVMGYRGVTAAVEAIAGKSLGGLVYDTGISISTAN